MQIDYCAASSGRYFLKHPCSNVMQKLILIICELAIPIYIFKSPRVENGELRMFKGKRPVHNSHTECVLLKGY